MINKKITTYNLRSHQLKWHYPSILNKGTQLEPKHQIGQYQMGT